MIEIVEFGDELRLFRQQTYERCWRDPARAAWWAADEHDERGTHLAARDERGELVGVARVLFDPPWPVDVATPDAALVSRIAVRSMTLNGRRLLLDLMLHALTHAQARGRAVGCATARARTLAVYRRFGVPFEVLPATRTRNGAEVHVMRAELATVIPLLEARLSRAALLPG